MSGASVAGFDHRHADGHDHDASVPDHGHPIASSDFGSDRVQHGIGVCEPDDIDQPGERCSLDALYAFAQQELGKYKTPNIIKLVDSLPKSPSGKVQRLKLLEF